MTRLRPVRLARYKVTSARARTATPASPAPAPDAFAPLAHVLAIRSEHESLFTQGLLSNLPLLIAVLAAFGLQLATIYHPVLNALFKTRPLTATELAACIALASLVFVAVEIEKWFGRRARRHTQLP